MFYVLVYSVSSESADVLGIHSITRGSNSIHSYSEYSVSQIAILRKAGPFARLDKLRSVFAVIEGACYLNFMQERLRWLSDDLGE